MARSYVKKSAFWDKRIASTVEDKPQAVQSPYETAAGFDEKTHYSAIAACGGGGAGNASRDQFAGTIIDSDSFKNIRSGLVPYEETSGGAFSVSTAIRLCYLTYFNFALLRNAINMNVDFSVGKIKVKTSNVRVKKFINQWLEAIKVNSLQAQYFLSYYRDGQVFPYAFNGKISEKNFDLLKESFGAKSPLIPIRYTILNPQQISVQRGSQMDNVYVRMMSTFEITRLKNPKTNEDKQVFNSLPENVKKQIMSGGAPKGIYVPLDPKRLYYAFYRKMDYEPMAVPMAWPILNDIEAKLELKKMDLALARTIEQVILLVTTGQKADQYNQSSGAKSLQALQDIFRNETIGRVLVADYTTKAEWAIPDLKGLLGPEKYQRIDQDIKEGLQYMFFGEEKFANAAIKAKIFLESLKEARRSFIEDFLLPEVKKVCAAMNFKNLPELEMEQIEIQDDAVMNRIYVQMAQLGLLTPDQLNEALNSGILPTEEEALIAQKEFKTQKDEGLFVPLIGGSDTGDSSGGDGRPSGGGADKQRVKTPIGQKKAAKASETQRESKYKFGMTQVAKNLAEFNNLKDDVAKSLTKKFKIKELNEVQMTIAKAIARAIFLNENEMGKEVISAYVKKPIDIKAEVTASLDEISIEFGVDSDIASVLLKSTI